MPGFFHFERAEALFRSARRFPSLIAASTPLNYRDEVERIAAAAERGERTTPRFAYRADDGREDAVALLERFAEDLERREDDPLLALPAARAREIALELRAADAVGTTGLAVLGKARFFDASPEADRLADAWVQADAGAFEIASRERSVLSSDAEDPRSLVNRMRREVTRVVPSFRVEVTPRLLSLAATGEGVILVAEGRRVGVADVERTVFHEVFGHARPQTRALAAPHPMFRVGTAKGSDDQEGYALVLEDADGHLVGARRAELGYRHLAARCVFAGGALADTVDALLARGAPPASAARIACRAHRGGKDGVGGIAREAVYLPAFLRARSVLHTPVFRALGHGRVSVAAAVHLAPLLGTPSRESVYPLAPAE